MLFSWRLSKKLFGYFCARETFTIFVKPESFFYQIFLVADSLSPVTCNRNQLNNTFKTISWRLCILSAARPWRPFIFCHSFFGDIPRRGDRYSLCILNHRIQYILYFLNNKRSSCFNVTKYVVHIVWLAYFKMQTFHLQNTICETFVSKRNPIVNYLIAYT